MPSPTKESSSSNIPIDNPIILEKAISVLKDVNNNPTAAIEKLLTPEKTKYVLEKALEHETNPTKLRANFKARQMRKDKSESHDEGTSNGPNRHVLKDDQFEALFAEDSIGVGDSTNENHNAIPPADTSINVKQLPRKRKQKAAPKVVARPVDSELEPQNKIWSDELDHK